MYEETKIIEKLKDLGEKPHMPDEEKFLKSLRIKLSDHISAHSAISENNKNVSLSKGTALFDYLKFIINNRTPLSNKAIGAATIICLLGISSAAIASQNSLPGEALYPIKILSEDFRSSLAVTPESRAKIQSSFTAKRVAEVKAIMEEKDLNPEILDLALTNLQKNTDNTATIINEESQKGTDIAELAEDISIDLNKNTDDLKQIFELKNTSLKEKENELKDKIEEAKKNDDQPSITVLNTQLDETNNKRKSLEASWTKNEEILNEHKHKIKKQSEKKRSEEQEKKQEQYSSPKQENKGEDDKEEETTSQPDNGEKDENGAKERKK